MCSQRARTEYPIFMRKNRGRLPSRPPTARAASLDISPGRSNFRTEIRHPAVPQTATGVIPDITLRLSVSIHQLSSRSLQIQGRRRESRHSWRLWRRYPFRLYAGRLSLKILWTCSVSSDTEQALRPQSSEVGTQAPGATCNMARRVCVPSLRSHRFQRFRMFSHKCSLWPTESGPVFSLQSSPPKTGVDVKAIEE